MLFMFWNFCEYQINKLAIFLLKDNSIDLEIYEDAKL